MNVAFRVILYTYARTFSIDPYEAQQTPIKLMLEMLTIHGEVESVKTKELDKATKKVL